MNANRKRIENMLCYLDMEKGAGQKPQCIPYFDIEYGMLDGFHLPITFDNHALKRMLLDTVKEIRTLDSEIRSLKVKVAQARDN